ncbi:MULTISPECIES: hypothetical protein [unclassified Streptomyces]|uniref:hypothetical protein n=1 Tax=unclassified Streptomyces TaxID=2593676 RepID=UPI0022577079|nr:MULTISPECIES: hypothetical protein [unclassified Streptomyces]MCX4798778.1 hypothetical protein [Streptomyces sp. NBC_01242]WSJ39986.1 hypothetical protein OG772_30950 [Streptomyces sp. NBC_01321]WSP66286.1 hypothetical protein OG466_33640 [Streptomyces sp. NBC_01240]WSU25459.1 hypothetical protein OG508_33980 [Streptomyces sp. NBC_01108]
MWPGQQPPGGEQNPQDQSQNPYQQPGYQQPNPYQQPGYQQQGQPGQQPGYQQQGQQPGYPQPNPYQQPTVPQYAVPGPPGGPRPDGGKKKTTAVAIVAATAVVVAAAVTGVVVMNKDDNKGKDVADDKNSSAPAEPSGSASSPEANPRGADGDAKPLIAGWKVVTNPRWGTQFDVPGDWEVGAPGTLSYFEDDKKGDGSPYIGFSAPSYYQSKWCVDDSDKDGTKEDMSLASAGSRGAQGATDAAKNARNEAGDWAWAAYAQHMPKSTIKFTEAKQYTTKSGLTGQVVTATAPNVTKRKKCDSDGKTIAFTFKNKEGDFASWILYAAHNVKDELPDTTIQKILSTVRLVDVTPSP